MTSPTSNTSAPANGEPPVPSHEVGMMFVHEYYTFLNKEPARLHCFYNKNSTMSHGYQGDETHVSYGQQDIHARILDLDFEDCKVLVSNVDSQSSMNGGIMIQVLGEMSNRGGPSQKFVQTFFLAEQPKGYYVLNDIFRYLKEDNDIDFEVVDEEPEIENQDAIVAVANEEVVVVAEVVSVVEDTPSAETTVVEEVKIEQVKIEQVKTEIVEEKKPVVEEKKSAEKKTENKKHDKKSERKDSKKDEVKEAKKEAKKEGDSVEKSKASESSKKQQQNVAAAAPVTETSQEETPASAPVEAEPTPAPVVAAAPVPAEPAKPKTWANLAAKWSNDDSAAKGTSVNVPQPVSKPQPPQPSSAQVQSKPQGQKPSGRDDVHGIYVKNITEKMSVEQLREAFSKFGPVKNIELTSKKNCAYVDFETIDAVQAALKQNKVSVGTETVLAEERRPKGYQSGNRPFHYQNGNGPSGNHQGPQGGHRGGGRSSRGGYQDRKSIQRPDKAAVTVAVN